MRILHFSPNPLPPQLCPVWFTPIFSSGDGLLHHGRLRRGELVFQYRFINVVLNLKICQQTKRFENVYLIEKDCKET